MSKEETRLRFLRRLLRCKAQPHQAQPRRIEVVIYGDPSSLERALGSAQTKVGRMRATNIGLS